MSMDPVGSPGKEIAPPPSATRRLSDLAFERYEALYEQELYREKATPMFASEHQKEARRRVYEAVIAECSSEPRAAAQGDLTTGRNRQATNPSEQLRPTNAAPQPDEPKEASTNGTRDAAVAAPEWLCHACGLKPRYEFCMNDKCPNK